MRTLMLVGFLIAVSGCVSDATFQVEKVILNTGQDETIEYGLYKQSGTSYTQWPTNSAFVDGDVGWTTIKQMDCSENVTGLQFILMRGNTEVAQTYVPLPCGGPTYDVVYENGEFVAKKR